MSAQRIASLIRLLDSSVDHEALASLRKLQRALIAAGVDFHWLAALAEKQLAGATLSNPRASARPPWQTHAADLLRRGRGVLNAAEVDFLRSMMRWPREPSIKQVLWLEDIALGLAARERAA